MIASSPASPSAVRVPVEPRLRPVAAAAVWLPAILIPLAVVLVTLAGPAPEGDQLFVVIYGGLFATWGMAGAFLVVRRPGNRVGWLIWIAAMGMGVAILGQSWAFLSLSTHAGTLPGTWAGVLAGLLFNPSLFLVVLLPYLFPTGRFLSRRWAVAGTFVVILAVTTFVATLVRPGPVEGMREIENPLGVAALGPAAELVIGLSGLLMLGCLVLAIAAAVVRFRRGGAVERGQLKWFGSVVVVGFSLFFAAAVLPQPAGQLAWIGATISLGLVPVAIGIAVLRYRLYDIDRVISRTVAYAVVTALLAGAFLGTNLALQALIADTLRGSTLGVALSTLVVAALFQPVRRRVQALVDRRFNRARTDAERVVEGFRVRTRDEVDLRRIHDAVVATTADAVHPDGAALWLRRT
ncbi:MAG TPA: hypothetical protein VFY23_16070 [Candidatus Limnocylindrales bacterium]|nr:hypothetical protein [Candidatus Limnocylindrales bacterium]